MALPANTNAKRRRNRGGMAAGDEPSRLEAEPADMGCDDGDGTCTTARLKDWRTRTGPTARASSFWNWG